METARDAESSIDARGKSTRDQDTFALARARVTLDQESSTLVCATPTRSAEMKNDACGGHHLDRRLALRHRGALRPLEKAERRAGRNRAGQDPGTAARQAGSALARLGASGAVSRRLNNLKRLDKGSHPDTRGCFQQACQAACIRGSPKPVSIFPACLSPPARTSAPHLSQYP